MQSPIEFLRSPEFLVDIEHNAHKWDREWVRYWAQHKSYAYCYFLDLSASAANDPASAREQIAHLSEEELYHFKPFGHYAFAIWVRGELIPGSTIVELGCGPGLLGKVIAPFCRRYIGIDYSKLALHLASVVSPPQCRYLHLSQYEEIEALASSVDLCVGRYFFGHQNLRNALWILTLFSYLLRPGGLVSADFFASALVGKKPQIILRPEDELSERYPSAVFEYTEDQIRELAARCDFTVDRIFYRPDKNARFALLAKPSDGGGGGVTRIDPREVLPPQTPGCVQFVSVPPEGILGEPMVLYLSPPLNRWLGRWNYRTKVRVLAPEDGGLRLEVSGTSDTSGGQYAGVRFPVHLATALRLDLSLVQSQNVEVVFVDGYDKAGTRVARWRWRVANSPPELGRHSHLLSPSHALSSERWSRHFVAEGVGRLQEAVWVEVFLLLRPGEMAGMVLHRVEVFR